MSRFVYPNAPLDFEKARAIFRLRLISENAVAKRAAVTAGVSKCMRCGSTESVALESSRTQYAKRCLATDCGALDGVETLPGNACRAGKADKLQCENWPKEDPNASIPLCRPCAKEHHEEWDETWRDYYAGLL